MGVGNPEIKHSRPFSMTKIFKNVLLRNKLIKHCILLNEINTHKEILNQNLRERDI